MELKSKTYFFAEVIEVTTGLHVSTGLCEPWSLMRLLGWCLLTHHAAGLPQAIPESFTEIWCPVVARDGDGDNSGDDDGDGDHSGNDDGDDDGDGDNGDDGVDENSDGDDDSDGNRGEEMTVKVCARHTLDILVSFNPYYSLGGKYGLSPFFQMKKVSLKDVKSHN